MKKYLIVLMVLVLISSISSTEQPNKIDISFMTLNMIIYQYFNESVTEQDSIAFRADSPWLLSYEKDRILLFNSDRVDGFQSINSFPATNHFVQQTSENSDIMTDFTDYMHLFEGQNVLFLNLDKEFYNLENLTDKDRINLLTYISAQLYKTYLKNYNRELIEMPDFMYPVADVTNIALSTLEYNLLLDAYQKSMFINENENNSLINNDLNILNQTQEEILNLLKQFYAIRLRRWRSQNAFVQTFELSQEKILGLSFFKAFELLTYLENLTIHERVYRDRRDNRPQRNTNRIVLVPLPLDDSRFPESIKPRNEYNKFVNQIITGDILHDKFYSIFDETLISINSMSRNKAENKGFILASLYDFLGWDYLPETTTDNFHIFLGNKLEMRTTEIDSIYNSFIESIDYEYLTSRATASVDNYLSNFNNKKRDYNLQIFFDHYTDDLFNNMEEYFINSNDRSILFPNVTRYKIKSPWMEIDIKKQGFFFNLNRQNKFIQTNINTNLILSVDFRSFGFDQLADTMYFENLSFTSNNLDFKINSAGELSFKDDVLIIRLVPRLRFQIEEEYWELVEELNLKLIERGVPANWLADNINHPDFRIYHSIVRNFTQMPEHQVSRGERDQNWYMRNFGVDDKVRRGADFRVTHRETLLAAERRHGIHYELLMAIMAIESDYANPRWRGTFYTFPTLVSQYVLLPRRQRFAVNELVALYNFTQKTNKDTYHFIGSFAGAAGWGQFIPSSMNSFFIDANDNFYDVDIYSIDDTLHSISNYLNGHGLSGRNIGNYQARFRAVRAYNHSDAYVRAVLYIYDELRKTRD
ncbi:MAG: lytic murein transglycosylase [Candidatus Cloacimonetes bacterium]|nr:lytic murein transglycosylase [Candidatus Cloacimonadota bacterium]